MRLCEVMRGDAQQEVVDGELKEAGREFLAGGVEAVGHGGEEALAQASDSAAQGTGMDMQGGGEFALGGLAGEQEAEDGLNIGGEELCVAKDFVILGEKGKAVAAWRAGGEGHHKRLLS